MKLPVGITGNMGCGKSTVTKMLANSFPNILIIDSDVLAKKILYEGDLKPNVTRILGENIFQNGTADLKRAASIIFNNETKKKQIENLVLPLLAQEIARQAEDFNGICVVESAIILESGTEKNYSPVVLTTCDRETQRKRLLDKGMTDKDINMRLQHQIPFEKARRRVPYVIETDCTPDELSDQVTMLYNIIKH